MKALFLSLFIFVSFCFTRELVAQPDVRVREVTDSIVPEKDNLYLLIERIYLASKAYKTGVYEFREEKKMDDPKVREAMKEWYEKSGIYPNILLMKERPAPVVEIIRKGKKKNWGDEKLKKISTENVESIEIVFERKVTALYGLSGEICVIRVKLKK